MKPLAAVIADIRICAFIIQIFIHGGSTRVQIEYLFSNLWIVLAEEDFFLFFEKKIFDIRNIGSLQCCQDFREQNMKRASGYSIHGASVPEEFSQRDDSFMIVHSWNAKQDELHDQEIF